MMVASLADAVGGLGKDGMEGQERSPLGDHVGGRGKVTSPAGMLEEKFNCVNLGIVMLGGPPVQPS